MSWTEKIKHISRRSITSFVGCLCFLAILGNVFCKTTYLFRNAEQNRARVAGISQEKDELDMIYVGGSICFGSWQALTAWHEKGFTSYCLGTDGIQAESLKGYIEYARESKHTKFFVIDAKPFLYFAEGSAEAAIRNGTDSMDITSPARYRLLGDYFAKHNIPKNTDKVSYYLDIAKYHTNTEQLGRVAAWLDIDNKTSPWNRGTDLRGRVTYIEKPVGFETERRGELKSAAQQILIELLEYGKREGLTYLFVITPHEITAEDQAVFNTVRDIIAPYGYTFLNFNEYVDEMGIDYATDFFNRTHLNVSGAAKYTAYLTDYLCANYDLPDHREDPAFADWDQAYLTFETEKEAEMDVYRSYLEQGENAHALGEKLRSTEDLSQWYSYASTDLFSMIVVTGDVPETSAGLLEQEILKKLDITSDGKAQIRFLTGGTVVQSNKGNNAQSLETDDLGASHAVCSVSTTDGGLSATVNFKELPLDQTGINLIVLNDYNGIVEDQRILRFEPDGTCSLERQG